MKPLMARRTLGPGSIRQAIAITRLKLYHRVLSHQYDTRDISSTSQALSDLVHLLGTDIVDGDNEDGFILLEQSLELVEISCLVFCLAPHVFLLEDRMFKGQGGNLVIVSNRVVLSVTGVETVCGLGCACRATRQQVRPLSDAWTSTRNNQSRDQTKI